MLVLTGSCAEHIMAQQGKEPARSDDNRHEKARDLGEADLYATHPEIDHRASPITFCVPIQHDRTGAATRLRSNRMKPCTMP
jgi:hypothetical protein